MATTHYDPAFSLFKRCVKCPDVAPSCPPNCKADEICSQTFGTCDTCAAARCVKTALSGATNNNNSNSDSGTNVGAIAGGVIGGVFAIGLITFLVWKFYLKGRRRDESLEEWDDMDLPPEKTSQFTMQRDARMSTHTVASMASTVLTRASNVIQIAYIPGVTNRTQSTDSPSRLVPPVPPIPMPTTNSAPSTPYSDQVFFVPGDLRDSTYSGLSSVDGRGSYARSSIAPSMNRSSVATTIYRSDAIVSPIPAQMVPRAKAAVVSVKSSQASSPMMTPDTPPVPQIDLAKHRRPLQVKVIGQGSSGPSPSGSQRSQATIARPVPLNIIKKVKSSPSTASDNSSTKASTIATRDDNVGLGLRPMTEVSMADSVGSSIAHTRANQTSTMEDSSSDDESSDDERPHSRSRRSLLNHNGVSMRDSEITEIQDTPATVQSPFADEQTTPTGPDSPCKNRKSAAALSMVEEERRLSVKHNSSSERSKSPFGDEHRV